MLRVARSLAALPGLFAVLFLAGACGSESGALPGTTPGHTARLALSGDITLFAASSLTDVFEEAGSRFEAANPGTRVRFNFGSSSGLATQIEEGAPADAFASADLAQADRLLQNGHIHPSTVFAKNALVLVVPRGSASVASFADLANEGVRLVLAGPEVPAGRYARQVIANASASGAFGADFESRVLANLRSEEANVRAVLAKVQLGEADAGFVYATDVAAAAGEVDVIQVPTEFNVVAEYPVALTRRGGENPVAIAFVEFLLSSQGQEVLESYGFEGR